MEDDYSVITKNDNDSNLTEFKMEDKCLIKQYIGNNTENFILKKDNYIIKFGFFKINGTYYVNINGENIINYNRFACIDRIEYENETLIIHNHLVGKIKIKNCSMELFEKSLDIMANYMKPKRSIFKEILAFFAY